MAKTGKAPKGFYSATEVMKKLGIASSTLYHHVETGKIKRVVPPDRRDGYYIKAEIDKMVRAKEAFMLQYATDTSTFEVAQEEDIQGIAELNAELFGGNGPVRTEQHITQFNTNPEIFRVLKQDDLIVGYIGVFPLKHEAIEKIMSGMAESRFRTEVMAPEYITQFKPGHAEEVFLIIGAKQGVKKSRSYGFRLIAGGVEFLETLARRGVIIKRLYATSRTQDGIRVCKSMGFKQVTPVSEEDNLLRFKLDLETTDIPLFKEYQRLVKQATAKSAKK